jgi:hypothetical protein
MKIMVIPDVQARSGDDFKFLEHVGSYMVDKKPDIVVQLGDFADMPSLSSYDKGKKSFEGARFLKDLEASRLAMYSLLYPLIMHNKRAKENHKKVYRPRLVLTLGNHENRIERAVNDDAKLEGLLRMDALPYGDWEVIPFLQPIEICGIMFAHYFPSGIAGRPATSASAMVSKLHMSCIAGHQQGKQVAYGKRPDGTTITCIIAGSCYEHNEPYMDFQSNKHWRGIIMLHEVDNGCFDEMFVSLKHLKERYKLKEENATNTDTEVPVE